MTIPQFADLVERAFKDVNHAKLPLLVVGPAGVGKTQVPCDFAGANGWGVEALCMPLVNPTFLMGYPYRENGHADHAPFGALARLMVADKPTVGILDDIGGASGETVKAALRLLQFREVCGRVLPDHVRLIALTNDIGHGMSIEGIVEPAKDRFVSIVNVEPSVDATVQYGLSRNWPAWLLAYLRNNPSALHDCKPIKSMQRSGATPRGWEGVARLELGGYLPCGQNGCSCLGCQIGHELVAGAIGKGQASAAMAFRGLVNQLPDVDAVILDPENSPLPDNPSAQWLISMALAGRMNGGNFGQIVRYLQRLKQMFQAFSIRDAVKAENMRRKQGGGFPKGYQPIYASRDFTSWVNSKDGQDIMSAAKD